jgi:hypothetical protein
MNSNKRSTFLILTVVCFGLTIGPVSAQTSDEGIKLYKSGKYGPALQIFEALAKKQPANAMTHYYIALCAHGMNQKGRAAQEYRWVANNSTGALKTAAQNGLDSVSRSGRSAQASAADAEARKAAIDAKKTFSAGAYMPGSGGGLEAERMGTTGAAIAGDRAGASAKGTTTTTTNAPARKL